MRKIEQAMCEAVKNRKNMEKRNTKVVSKSIGFGCHYITVFLHDNLIYRYNEAEDWGEFTLAGLDTNVTRNRLRALGVNLTRCGGVTYYGGMVVDKNKWYEI